MFDWLNVHRGTSDWLNVHRVMSDWLNVHRGTSDWLNVHRGTSDWLNVHRGTSDWLNVHRVMSDWLNVHRGTSDWLNVHRGTSDWLNVHRVTSDWLNVHLISPQYFIPNAHCFLYNSFFLEVRGSNELFYRELSLRLLIFSESEKCFSCLSSKLKDKPDKLEKDKDKTDKSAKQEKQEKPEKQDRKKPQTNSPSQETPVSTVSFPVPSTTITTPSCTSTTKEVSFPARADADDTANSPTTVQVFINHSCHSGPYLNPAKVAGLPSCFRGSVANVARDCIQSVVNAAIEPKVVFGFLKSGNGRTRIVAKSGGKTLSCVLQHIDRVSIFWRVLEKFSDNLQCCENLFCGEHMAGPCPKCGKSGKARC